MQYYLQEARLKHNLIHAVLGAAVALGISVADMHTIQHVADEVHARTHAHAAMHDQFLDLLNKTDVSKSDKALVTVYAYTAIDPNIKQLSSDEKRDVLSIALNVYHEVRGDVVAAQYAVAHVTKNRAENNITSNSCYGVVWSPHQFSWTRSSLQKIIPHDQQAWKHAQQVAYQVYTGKHRDNTHGSTNFYAPNRTKETPAWIENSIKTVHIGQQIFAKLENAFEEQHARLARLLESAIGLDF